MIQKKKIIEWRNRELVFWGEKGKQKHVNM